MVDSRKPVSLTRTLGNTAPSDVGRGIIRITRSDAEQLGAGFGSILEIKRESGATAYAKSLVRYN